MFLLVLILIIIYSHWKKWIDYKSLADFALNVFDPQYYIAKPVTIRIYSGIRESLTNELLLPADQAYLEAPAKYEFIPSRDPLGEMEAGKFDLAIVRRTGQTENYKNVRFVGNIRDSTLMLMSPNDVPVQDLSDLSNAVSPTIHVNNTAAELMMKDLLKEYPDINATIINGKVEDLNASNHTLYAFLVIHPSPDVAKFLIERPMHLVTMNKINHGDYIVLDDEKQFYKSNKQYEKSTFDMHIDGVKYYPGLSLRGQNLYYPTIKFKYALFAHKDFSDKAVSRLLKSLISKKLLTLAEVAYEPDGTIPTHKGASSIYYDYKIYTTAERPPIWQGF